MIAVLKVLMLQSSTFVKRREVHKYIVDNSDFNTSTNNGIC